jgi:precorrin-6A/cobalt-precorrin-6A reductase
MQGPVLHQGQPAKDWIWLFAGTGEGPVLAEALLQRGWNVRVSVVTPGAARAYGQRGGLEVRVGACSNDQALAQELRELTPRWVVDATHPFAVVISERLQRLCSTLDQPLLQIERRLPAEAGPGEQLDLLDGVCELEQRLMAGEHLLLAIGARELNAAIAAAPQCTHYARVLDQPSSLQAALAAGLPQEHIACLRPDPTGAGELEQALCRRWSITQVLCRQGGGRSEALWRRVCRQMGLPLLLLRRPSTSRGLPMAALLEKLGQPSTPHGRRRDHCPDH